MSQDKGAISTKGWNWGHYQMMDDEMEFQVDKKRCFGIKFKDIALSSAHGKNEVAFEFAQDEAKKVNPNQDILCEMRFHVLNNEVDKFYEDKEAAREEDAEESENEEEVTASKLFDDKIHKVANIGEFAGEIVCSIPDLPMLIPRGNYSLDFYSNFAKLHGKTHDYKIMFKDINKIFMLPQPDGVHMVYLMHLDQPLRQGSTHHTYIAMRFEQDREVKIKLNLTPDQIKQKYGDQLKPENEDKLFVVLSDLFNNLAGIKRIIVPKDFNSARQTQAIKCSVKAAEGLLYPLRSSMVFIHKPVLYIRHSELKHVEFSRIGQGTAGLSRSFDITLTKLKDDTKVTFLSIDKEEQQCLMQYFKANNIKMRTVDVDTNEKKLIESDSGDSDEEMKEDRPGKRVRKTQKVDLPDYDDEEDDDDFEEGSAGSGSGDSEDGEDEQSEKGSQSKGNDSDVIDEEVNQNELKALQKEVGNVDMEAGRPKRRRK